MDAAEKKPGQRVAWALILARLFEIAGVSPLFVYIPPLIADFFASEDAHRTIHCTDYSKENMPDECFTAHTKAVLVSAVSSIVGNGIVAFCLSPFFGAWSDRYGRKPFMMLNTAGFMMSKIFLILYAHYGVSLYWYFLAAIAAFAVYNQGIFFAYLGDVVPAEKKSFYFASLIAIDTLGLLVGSGLVLIDLITSLLTATLVGMASNGVMILFIVFGLPETAESSQKAETRAKVSFLSVMSILTQNRVFACLTVCIAVVSIATSGSGEIFSQYVLEVSSFGTKDLAIASAIRSVASFSAPALVYFFSLLLKFSQTRVLMASFIALFIYFFMLAFAVAKPVVFAAIPFDAFSVVALTTLSSMKSDMVSEDQQGAVQGSINAVRSVVSGFSPFVILAVFVACRNDNFYFPGAVMLLLAGVQLFGLFAARRSHQYLTQGPANNDMELGATVAYKPVVDTNEPDPQ